MSGEPKANYTCTDYREEMRLLALKRQLERTDLDQEDRRKIVEEMEALEKKMGM